MIWSKSERTECKKKCRDTPKRLPEASARTLIKISHREHREKNEKDGTMIVLSPFPLCTLWLIFVSRFALIGQALGRVPTFLIAISFIFSR